MTGTPESASGSFGGQWTVDKLYILENYLDAYTTALKKPALQADVRRCLCRYR